MKTNMFAEALQFLKELIVWIAGVILALGFLLVLPFVYKRRDVASLDSLDHESLQDHYNGLP